jgi:D-alanine-D-alanine ligase
MPSSRRIVVLAGGESAEREISLHSGRCVAEALRTAGRNVAEVDPAVHDLAQWSWQPGDVALIALHGEFGEDGQVQDLLELLGIPYTGSGPEPSRLAFSKSAAKVCFLKHGVPTPEAVVIHRDHSSTRLRHVAEQLGFPLVVKPDQQGSSLGVSLVCSPLELEASTVACFQYGPCGLLERAIAGSEWTVALLDDEPLPPIQIVTSHSLFDFHAKYVDESTTYAFDSDLPRAVVTSIVDAGRRACAALGTAGIARVDLRLDESLRPWVLEVNTVPGMTDHSLVPKAAARAGMSFSELCEQAVERAVRRHAGDPRMPVARIARPVYPHKQAG